MNCSPILIEDTNLSNAWRKALGNIVSSQNKELTPLLLSLSDFEETHKVRALLDSNLKRNKKASIQTVSETIFPESLYHYYGKKRRTLYKEYLSILPRIQSIDTKNRRGTYFGRLIDYDLDGKTNQLEIIISSLLEDRGVRRSKLQASIFDPKRDHINSPYQGFPCLQHITFYPTKNGGLILNSFYAIQYIYERAYGNWLGLINLGKFMANELGLKFERFNCYIGIEKLDCLTKEGQELLEETE